MISEEVQMLQRDHPSPSFGEPDPNTLRPPGASQTVDPENIGENVGPVRMGENDTASQEGPLAQGAGAPIRADEDVSDSSKLSRGARTPHDAVEEPAAGGTSVMGATRHSGDAQRTTRLPASGNPPPTIQPGTPSSADLLSGTYSPATIAGAGFESVIENRMKTVAGPGQQDARDPRYLAQKMMSGQFVRFASREERAAVEEQAKKIAERRSRERARQKGLSSEEVQPTANNYEFNPLPDGVRKAMVDRMVMGTYDPKDFLGGKQNYKQPVLNEIAKMTLRNETYLSGDGDRFLRKVQSLLPAAPAAQAQQRNARQSQKAS